MSIILLLIFAKLAFKLKLSPVKVFNNMIKVSKFMVSFIKEFIIVENRIIEYVFSKKSISPVEEVKDDKIIDMENYKLRKAK